MKLSLSKKVLLSMGVLAGIGSLAGAGTFASFTAQDKNPGNTFASGTLVLSDTAPTGGACLSTSAGVTDSNVNSACSTAYALNVQKPGDSGTADITLKNEGSLAASALKLFSSAVCANSNNAESFHGTGLPCGKVQLYVQQWTSAAHTTAVACLYGATTTTNVCDFAATGAAAKTLADFSSTYTSSATLGAGTLAAGASTYITIGVKLPSDADNTYQGRVATSDFTWLIEQ